MPWLDLRQARQEVRLQEVLELLGWRPRLRAAAQVRGPCPVHGSRSATSRAFSAHLERGIWHCFVCAASGNALDLWAQVTQQEIYPAVLDLYCRLGRTAPRSSPRPKEKQAMPDP